jgi:hypothetical protein
MISVIMQTGMYNSSSNKRLNIQAIRETPMFILDIA